MTKALYKLFTKINTAVAVIFEIIQEIFFFMQNNEMITTLLFGWLTLFYKGRAKKS